MFNVEILFNRLFSATARNSFIVLTVIQFVWMMRQFFR